MISKLPGGIALFLLVSSAVGHAAENAPPADRKGKMIFAVHELKPGIFKDGNTWKGAEYQAVELLAKTAGLELVVVECTFARCQALLEKGEADVQSHVIRTAKREAIQDFIEPAANPNVQRAFFVSKSSGIKIEKFEDTVGKRTSKNLGITHGPEVDGAIKEGKIKAVDVLSMDQGYEMLLKDRIDFSVDLPLTGLFNIHYRGLGDKIVRTPLSLAVGDAYLTISKKSQLDRAKLQAAYLSVHAEFLKLNTVGPYFTGSETAGDLKLRPEYAPQKSAH